MLCNYKEFIKLFRNIPVERLDYTPFILLRPNAKLPFSSWKEKSNWLNYYSVIDHMNAGWNIGCVALPKGLMILDLDVDEKMRLRASTDVLREIPETFSVRTRSGGLHYYFLNEGNYTTQNFTIGGIEIGELRACWSYVLCPGSYVEPGQYKVVNDVPIAKFEGNILNYFSSDVNKLSHSETASGEVLGDRVIEGKRGKKLTEEKRREIYEKFGVRV